MQVRVCGVAGLGEGQALEFAFEREGQACKGFVLRHAGALHAYLNRCPHWGVDLDMGEGRFFSALSEHIICSTHGALFVPSSGYCDLGPCVGDSLERFSIAHEDKDTILVTIADVDPNPRW